MDDRFQFKKHISFNTIFIDIFRNQIQDGSLLPISFYLLIDVDGM